MSQDVTPHQIGSSGDSPRETFGKTLVALADRYPEFVVLDADVAGETGTHHFRKARPDRFYQCGIAEQNMMSVAAGMASVGIPVFVTSFAVFMLRALEQVRLSIAYPGRNVKIVASHPGLEVGPDGGSTQCLEDLAAFRAIPGMTVVSPADPLEMAQATEAVLKYNGPVYMRSGLSEIPRFLDPDHHFVLGKASVLRSGTDVTLVASGRLVASALEAAQQLENQGFSARVVNMSTIKPIDVACLTACARETGCMVTAEDHNIYGGLGSAVAEALVTNHPCPLEMIGVRDCFGESGECDELHEKYGLTATAIAEAAKVVLVRKQGWRP